MTALMRKAERTYGPLPRLVPHDGINRDMIVMMGGYRVIASDGSARRPAW
jgi:hypothetical protein